MAAHQRQKLKKKHRLTLDAADHVSAANAADVMTVVAAANAVDAAVGTIAMEEIVPHAKTASHPSHVSREVIALHANQERIAQHVSHAQRGKNNANHVHHVNREMIVQHVNRASHVQRDKSNVSHALRVNHAVSLLPYLCSCRVAPGAVRLSVSPARGVGPSQEAHARVHKAISIGQNNTGTPLRDEPDVNIKQHLNMRYARYQG